MKRIFKKLTAPQENGRALATPAGEELAKLVKQALAAKQELLGTEMETFLSMKLEEKYRTIEREEENV